MENRKTNINVSYLISQWALPLLLLIFLTIFSTLTPKFFTQLNLTNILVQNVHVAVLTSAVMIIMISGGCDLSIGYQVSVTAVVMTKLISDYNTPVWIAVLLGIVVCMLLGTFNGFIALKLKSHAMMVTLGTMAIFQGLSYLISDSKTFFKLPDTYKFIGQGRLFGWLPVNIIVMVLCLAAVSFVMSKTYLGRHIYAVGDNPESARLAGLKVRRIKILAFTSGGLLVGIAAILLSSRAGSADSSTGLGLEFTGITACVLGGVALKGGEGTLWRVIVAVFVLGVLSNGMQLIGLGTYPQYIAKGVIMLASIWLSNRNAPEIG